MNKLVADRRSWLKGVLAAPLAFMAKGEVRLKGMSLKPGRIARSGVLTNPPWTLGLRDGVADEVIRLAAERGAALRPAVDAGRVPIGIFPGGGLAYRTAGGKVTPEACDPTENATITIDPYGIF